MTIDDYVQAVRGAVREPGALEGLEELRAALAELAEASGGEDAACLRMGDPREYAAQLDEVFAIPDPDRFDPPAARTFLGVPWNLCLDGDWWRRVFNPADPRLMVPHIFGWGYSINLGAVAVRIGGLHPDDVGDDTLARLKATDAAGPLAAATALAAAHLLRTTVAGDNRRVAEAAKVAVAVGVSGLPTLAGRPVIERMAAQSLGYVVLGLSAMRSRHPLSGSIGALAGIACAVAGFTVPLRAAVRRAATASGEPHED